MNPYDFRDAETKYKDELYYAHLDGDCNSDCQLCQERDDWNRAYDLGLRQKRMDAKLAATERIWRDFEFMFEKIIGGGK